MLDISPLHLFIIFLTLSFFIDLEDNFLKNLKILKFWLSESLKSSFFSSN